MTRAFPPGPVRQNGYVVADLDRALAHWVGSLGIGPWLVLRGSRQDECRFRGAPVTPAIDVAFSASGSLQLELIQPLDDEPSAYRAFLDAGHEGLHHLAWWTESYAADAAVIAATGEGALQEGRIGDVHYAYFDLGGHPGTVVELMELTDTTRWLDRHVREAVERWDGTSDPIRPLF